MNGTLEPTFLVYCGGGNVFQSKLVCGLDQAFEAVVQFIFGEPPDPIDEAEAFDELVVVMNDFKNHSFWKEAGSLWETDFSTDSETGFVVVVKVESLLN